MFDEYFQPLMNVDHLRSTTQTTQEAQSLVIPQGIDNDYHDIVVALLNNDPLFGFLLPNLHDLDVAWEAVACR